jgi:fatty-acyl-CoA synthase
VGVLERVGQFQQVFADRALVGGQRIALLGDGAELWCAMTAAQASGLCTAWPHPRNSVGDLALQVEHLEPSAIRFDKTFAAHGSALADRVSGAIPVHSLGAADFGPDLSDQPRDRHRSTAGRRCRPLA